MIHWAHRLRGRCWRWASLSSRLAFCFRHGRAAQRLSAKRHEVAERIEQSRIDAMEARIEEDRRLLFALRNDPVVIARLARRDLHMNVTNDQWVPVDVPGESGPSERYFDPPPDIASILAEQTPRTDSEARLAAVLTNDRNRLTLLAMSLTLIGVAMWLPTRRMSG